MSKVAKTAAIVVGAVALVATGVGAAIGAGTIIAAGVSVGTVATIANVTAGALSLASALTAPKPSSSVSGSQTSFSANPDDALPLMIGRTGTAGKIAYRVGFDTRDAGDNDRESFVVTLSVGPIDAIEGQTVDQALVSYSGAGAALGTYAGWMWSRTQLGATPEPAALGFGTGAGSPPGWTSQHRLSGKAAATWTLRFDTKGKMFQGGEPAPMWIGRGIRCYDPTKDSTYPGGSGPHRMADPADRAAYDAAQDTWTFTEDPYLIGLRWAHGIWQRDRSNPSSVYERVMGIGAPWPMIDVASFVEGRNIATANGWKAGGIIYSTDGKWDTMKRILQAGMGEPLALGARISCLVNTPKVSLATITIDDVVGAASVSGTQSRRDRINTITPRYRLEANNWQFLPGPPISVAAHVAEDKGKRSRLQDYAFIQSTPQVATAVRYDIENAREFGPVVLPLKLVWMGYKPGDCVTATLPELGLNAQTILLLNRELSPASGVVTMTARSETAAKHPFALGQTTTPPPSPGITSAPLVPVPRDGDWTLSALPAGGQLVTPTLAISGAAAANVEGIVFEYRIFDSGQLWTAAGSDAATATYREITGLRAGTAYEVAVSYTKHGITGDRRIVGPVTTAIVAVQGEAAPLVLTQWSVDGTAGWHFDYVEGDLYQRQSNDNGTTWGPSVRVVGEGGIEGQDGISPLTVFKRSTTVPAAPANNAGHPPPGWSDAPPTGTDLLWQSKANYRGGVQLTDYSAPARISGENAQTITLSADKGFARYDKNDAHIGGPITFTAIRQNVPGTGTSFAIYRVSDGTLLDADTADNFGARAGGYWTGSGGDKLVITDIQVEGLLAAFGTFRVEAYRDGYASRASVGIAKVKDGSDGPNGLQGPQGVPGTNGTGSPGAPGANGLPSKVHFAYADSIDGSYNFTTGEALGRYFIGVYADYVDADSGNYLDYTWSLFRGADGANGIPGPPGANGQPTYIHVAYANSPDGSANFSVDDPIGRAYVGIRHDFVLADSGNYADYTWSLIKGADGAPGAPGNPGAPGAPGSPGQDAIVATPTPASHTVLCDFGGNPKTGQASKTAALKVVSGSTDVTSGSGFQVTETSGCGASVNGSTLTMTTFSADDGYAEVAATYGAASRPIRVTFSKARDGAPGTSASATLSISANGSWNDASQIIKLAVQGVGTITASASWRSPSNNSNKSGGIRILYRVAGTTTWSQLAENTNSAPAQEPFDVIASGSFGTSEAQVYEFVAQAYRTGTHGLIQTQPLSVGWQP